MLVISSAKVEFKSMAKGICELLWIGMMLSNLGMELEGSMKLYCDKLAISIAHKNPS